MRPGEEEVLAGSRFTETPLGLPRETPPGRCEGGGDRGLQRGPTVWLRPQPFSRGWQAAGWRPLSAGLVRSVWCPLPSGCHQVLDPRSPCPQGCSLSYRRRLAVTLGSAASAGVLWAWPGVLAVSSCRAEPPHRTWPCPRQRHPGTLWSPHFCSRRSEVFLESDSHLGSQVGPAVRPCVRVHMAASGARPPALRWPVFSSAPVACEGVFLAVPSCLWSPGATQPHSSLLGASGFPFEEEASGGSGNTEPGDPSCSRVTGHSTELSPAPPDGVPSPSCPTLHPAPRKALWGRDPRVGSVHLGAPRSAVLCDSSELS